MRERWRQVLLGFARRRWNLWLGVAACICLSVAFLGRNPRAASQHSPFFGVVILMSMITGLCLAAHIREIFDRAESRLIPGFAETHLFAAVAIASALFVVAPTVLAPWCGCSPLAAVSVAVLCSGLGSLVLCFPPLACFWPIVLLACHLVPGLRFEMEKLGGLHGGVGSGGAMLVVIGLGLHASALVRLVHLPGRAEARARRPSPISTHLSSIQDRFFPSPLNRLDGLPTRDLWGRARVRRMAIEAAIAPSFLPICTVTAVLLRLFASHVDERPATLLPMCAWMPLSLIVSLELAWFHREHLFPATRPRLAQEMALAVTMLTARMWFFLSVTEMFLCALLDPASVHNPGFYGVLAASLTFQVMVVVPGTLALWVFPLAARIVVLFLVTTPCAALFALQCGRVRSFQVGHYIFSSAILLGLGMAVAWAAYRRWMRCELA